MITETEKNALQLAKKVFEHFTHDALPIAREIIAMEHELAESPAKAKPVNGKPNPIPEGEKMDGPLGSKSLIDLLASDPMEDLRTDHETSVLLHQHHNEVLMGQQDDLPF